MINFTFLLNFLSKHLLLSYLILFLGSFFETIFLISFLLPGELFFLSGSILAGMGYLNIWIVIFVLYTGAIMGDNISFLLGRKYGKSFLKRFENKLFFGKFINEKKYNKSKQSFRKYGKYGVFFARFLGPVSWFFPFIAGSFKLEWPTFIKYNIPGVIFGVGQFIFVGYFGGKHYRFLLGLISKYLFVLLFVLISCVVVYFFLKKLKFIKFIKENIKKNKRYLIKFIIKNFILVSVIIFILFAMFLGFLFFNENTIHNQNLRLHNLDLQNSIKISNILSNCSNLKVYYNDNPSNAIQPINIIIYSNSDIDKIMNSSYWIKNKIIGIQDISLGDFLKLFLNKTPVVSNLYFYNKPQDFAFQKKTDSYISRDHIRFWKFNSKNNNYSDLYIASISRDNGITFQFYNKFITPVHEISQNIDQSRELFKNYLTNSSKFVCKYVKTNCVVKKDIDNKNKQNYYTDGKILVCDEKMR